MSNSLNSLLGILIQDITALPATNLHIATVIVPDAITRAWFVRQCASSLSLLRLQVSLPQEILTNEEGTVPKQALYPFLYSFFSQQNPRESPEKVRELCKKWLLPFSLRAFLDDKSWFKEKNSEELWQAFVSFCPFSFLPAIKKTQESTVPHFLFGFSSIHPLLLHRLSIFNIQRLYLLSPCALFWEDVPTDREMKKLLSLGSRLSQEALETLLYDRHRFLANTGYLGRQFARLIEDENIQTKSAYVIPESLAKISPYNEYIHDENVIPLKTSTCTLLDYLKADLLLLHNGTTLRNIACDTSIEIHEAYTLLREVEALYEYLTKIYRDTPLPPASVLILAQDPHLYKTFLEQVFGSIRYHIINDPPHYAKSPKIFLSMLLAVLSSKGSKESWIQLARHEVFHYILGISPDVASTLIDWLQQVSADCICSQKARAHYLEERGIIPRKNIRDLRSEIREPFFNREAEATIKIADTEVVSRFLYFIESIEQKWALPLNTHALLRIEFWSSLFSFLVEQISGFESPETQPIARGFSDFQKLASKALLSYQEATSLFFDLIEPYLFSSACLSVPILVAPLGVFQPIPSSVIAILGAQEGTYPEYSQEKLLLRLDRLVPGVPPSNEMLDRYTFIEALLSASHLFIGYQGYDFATKERISYSPVVADLLAHLDTNYTLDGMVPSNAIVKRHPLHTQKIVQDEKKIVLPELRKKDLMDQKAVELRALQKIAKDPLEYFYRHTYGVVPSYQKRVSVFVRPWRVREHIKTALGGKKGREELSFFENHEYKAATKWAENTLQGMNLSLQQYDLHLIASVERSYIDQQQIFSPIIAFNDSLSLIGSWQGLHDQGMLICDEAWKTELFQRWPECLLRSFLASQQISLSENVIILSQQKVFSCPSPEPFEHLKNWAEFSLLAKKIAFPFTYDIVQMLVKDSGEVMEELKSLAEDDATGIWSAFTSNLQDPDIPLWKEWACRLWSEYFVFLEKDHEL